MSAYSKIFSVFCLTVFIVSCKKDVVPKDSETTPVFKFTGEIANIPTTINAGQENYYMSTYITEDANNLKTYTSSFAQVNCIDFCEKTLKISFIDYATSNPIATMTDSTLYVGFYNFATNAGKPSRNSVAFTKTTLGPVVTEMNWDFGDGNSKLALNPVHTYVRPGNYEVCMNAQFTGGCVSNLCNTISIGNTGPFIEPNFVEGAVIGTSIAFSANGNLGTAPYTYAWDFGDGTTGIEQNPIHNFPAEGVYTVELVVTDAQNVSATVRQNVRTQNSTDCVARFTRNLVPINNPQNMGNIVIEWVDENGVLYTSKADNQDQRSFFRINSIEEYQTNENGYKTKKVNVTFSCILYNGVNTIEIKNATSTIAVAYE